MKALPTILVAILSVLFLSAPTIHHLNEPTISEDLLQREIQSLTDRGLHVKLFDGVVEATDPVSGQKWRFSTDMLIPREPRYTGLPTLTIDLRTIDTNQYNWKYRYVNSFPLSSEWGFPLQVKDIDQNGKAEAYGVYQTQADYFTRAYEFDSGSWVYRVGYPIDTGFPDKEGDVDNNGLREVYFRYRDSLHVFEQSSSGSLPFLRKFGYRQWFYSATGIPNQVHDMNGDSIADVVFEGSEPDSMNPPFGSIRKTYIAKYLSSANSFSRIWSAQLPFDCPVDECASAIACGDFDGDGHHEFVTSAIEGGVFVIEHVLADSFSAVWVDSLPVGSRVAAGDVDGNGITEFFVGGSQMEGDGFAHLRAYAFERVSDNVYQPVFEIHVFPVGLFFVDLYQTADVDGDEVPELLLSIGAGPVIIKGIAPHDYELFYHHPFGYLDAVTVAKGGNIPVPRMFVSKHLGGQPVVKMTETYRLDSTLIVNVRLDDGIRRSPNLRSFPNPFNGRTQIQFFLNARAFVILTIHDINGKEVATLIKSMQEAGTHSIAWDPASLARNSTLASGVYFCRLTIGGNSLVGKLLFMK